MDPTIKQQWVDALRSGTYRQVYGALRSEAGYCVLGVLCDLHSQATGKEWTNSYNPLFHYSYYNLNGVPDPLVMRWAELPLAAIGILQKKNDDEEITFLDLADYIDANL